MILDSVVPWGRSLSEYRRMFDLTEVDLAKTILGVGDGPASFNAEMTNLGHSVVSIDPVYAFSRDELAFRIEKTYATVVEQTRSSSAQYNWVDFRDADDLGIQRMKSMNLFMGDYETGRLQRRYRAESLPVTSFPDLSFNLALCSHFLFLYTAQLSEEFHKKSVRELVRVTDEVRIFPLLDLNGELSPYVNSVVEECRKNGLWAKVVEVPYHFQKNGNQMLCIKK